MKFIPNEDDVSIEGIEDGNVLLGIGGVKTWKEGQYRNEKNSTQVVPVSLETAKELIGDMQDAVEQIEQ